MQSHDGGAHLPLGGASTRCQKAEGRLLRGLASTCKLLRGKVKRQADRDGTQTSRAEQHKRDRDDDQTEEENGSFLYSDTGA